MNISRFLLLNILTSTFFSYGMMNYSTMGVPYFRTIYNQQPPQPAFPIKDLPIDIVTVVARHLSLQDQAFLAASCKHFKTIHFYAAKLRLPLEPKISFMEKMSNFFDMPDELKNNEDIKKENEKKKTFLSSACKAIENRLDDKRLTIDLLEIDLFYKEQVLPILNIIKKSNSTSLILGCLTPAHEHYSFCENVASSIASNPTLKSLAFSTAIETKNIHPIITQCIAIISLSLSDPCSHAYVKDLIACLNAAPHVTTLSLKSDTMSQFEICKELAKNNHLKKIKLSGININHPICIPRAMEEIEEMAGIYEGRLEDKYYLKYYPESIKRYGYNAFQKVKLRKDELDAFLEPHRKLAGAIEALMMSPHLEELDLSQNRLCDYLKNDIRNSPSKPNNLVVKL